MTTHKKCGLLIFPGGLPQAPSRRQSAAPLLLLINCVTNVAPFPQKSQTFALNLVRGCLPQSLHSPQYPSLTRFTLIYPSCSASSLATTVPSALLVHFETDNGGFASVICTSDMDHVYESAHSFRELYPFNTTATVRSNDNRSLFWRFTGALRLADQSLRECCRRAARSEVDRLEVR